MNICISMTKTLTATFHDAEVAKVAAESDTRFVFGCTRRHVLADDGTAPVEITWIDDGDDRRFDAQSVNVDELSPTHAAHWSWFRQVIAAADADGRVWWGLGRGDDDETGVILELGYLEQNYPTVAARLTDAGHHVLVS